MAANFRKYTAPFKVKVSLKCRRVKKFRRCLPYRQIAQLRFDLVETRV